MRGELVVLMIMGVCCAVSYAQPGADRTYTGYYTGVIIPTPQEVTYGDQVWPLPPGLAVPVVVGEGVGTPELLAAREIANRIVYLGGQATVVTEDAVPEDAPLVIVVGQLSTNRLLARHAAACGMRVPQRAEGYALACYEPAAGGRAVLCAGADPTGCYFSAQSLVQLFDRGPQAPVLHPAEVRDWPVFVLRSFKTGGSPGVDADTGLMARWAPSAKFNCYNICYTTLGQDRWVDPPPQYREFVAWVTEYMVARGLDTMPFVNPYYLWAEHIEVTDPGDLDKLFEACRLGPEAGGTRVMLCLDDFASEPDRAGPRLYHVRSERDRARYGDDLGRLNVDMINDLHRRLKQAYPQVKLYVVPPYYWTPTGSYKEGGEADLRTIGAGVDPEVQLVWTGPRVRSTHITASDLQYYQNLVGRKVMLWDNTLYARHNPPHFFLDDWVTVYPDDLATASSGEVHLNAGSGEAYKAGLLAAADRLWNPAAYDPQRSMRNALAAVIGPSAVDAALEFRDVFYRIYDQYSGTLGSPAHLLRLLEQAKARPFDAEDLTEIRGLLERLKQLRDQIAQLTDNSAFVAQVDKLLGRYAGYQQVLARLEELPPLPATEGGNILANPGAEEGAATPAHWGRYAGAGEFTLTRDTTEAHSGQASALLEATAWHQMPEGPWLNVAAIISGSNGYAAGEAPEVAPFTKYYFRCWLKGSLPKVQIALQCWASGGNPGDRRNALGGVREVQLTGDWQLVETSFLTAVDAARAAVKIGPVGYQQDGAALGKLWIDDVYLGRSRPED